MPNILHLTPDLFFHFQSQINKTSIFLLLSTHRCLWHFLSHRFTADSTCRMSTYLSLYSFTAISRPFVFMSLERRMGGRGFRFRLASPNMSGRMLIRVCCSTKITFNKLSWEFVSFFKFIKSSRVKKG